MLVDIKRRLLFFYFCGLRINEINTSGGYGSFISFLLMFFSKEINIWLSYC